MPASEHGPFRPVRAAGAGNADSNQKRVSNDSNF
jgi:hypothetical protein